MQPRENLVIIFPFPNPHEKIVSLDGFRYLSLLCYTTPPGLGNQLTKCLQFLHNPPPLAAQRVALRFAGVYKVVCQSRGGWRLPGDEAVKCSLLLLLLNRVITPHRIKPLICEPSQQRTGGKNIGRQNNWNFIIFELSSEMVWKKI